MTGGQVSGLPRERVGGEREGRGVEGKTSHTVDNGKRGMGVGTLGTASLRFRLRLAEEERQRQTEQGTPRMT